MLSWLMTYVSNSLLSGFIYASNTWVLWEELKERFDKINGARTFNLYKSVWSRFVCIAYLGWKNIGFIDGTCKKEKYAKELWAKIEKV